MKKQITPCIWYNNQANEAADLYCSAFSDTKIAARSPLVTELSISGERLILLDGGPMFQPNPSISLFLIFETSKDFEKAWETLKKEGSIIMPADKYPWAEKYGWLTDKYGVSWQLSQGKLSDVGQRLTPCIHFSGDQDGRAEEAIEHYSSIFNNSSVDGILRFEANDPEGEKGKVKHAQIVLDGSKLMLMDTSSEHKFSEGVSLTVYCDTQDEIDHYWESFTESGSESMCGWLKDRFGVSWQIIPSVLDRIMSDPAKAGKAAKAFMSMRKLNIEQIVQASMAEG